MSDAEFFLDTIEKLFSEADDYAGEETAVLVACHFYDLTITNQIKRGMLEVKHDYRRPTSKETVRPCVVIKFHDKSSLCLFEKTYRTDTLRLNFFDFSKTLVYNWLDKPTLKTIEKLNS